MVCLPLANILHHKVRSVLSALGIGIGVCMLVTLTGLTRGSLNDPIDRWQSIDAGLMIFPNIWRDDLITMTGIGIEDKQADLLAAKHGELIERIVPVFLARHPLGGQHQTVVGVEAGDWRVLTGRAGPQQGRLFAPTSTWPQFEKRIEAEQCPETRPADAEPDPFDDRAITIAQADSGGWLEMVIDSRLARAGQFRVDDVVEMANHRWRIVGIVEAGGMARVYVPRATAQHLFGSGSRSSTLFFVRLRDGVDVQAAGRALNRPEWEVGPVEQYGAAMRERFAVMYLYVDAVNGIAMVIAFLFIMVTLYTMVLERRREIAILKANGASNAFLTRQVLGESLLLTGAGAGAGVALSFAARWGIETWRPLLTVDVQWPWIVAALVVAGVGAVLSAAYPAWRAMRVDMAEALTFE